MKIAIFGAGGVGGYLGGLLARAGHEVVFIARGRHLEAIKTRGLQIKSVHGDFILPSSQATDEPEKVGVVDYVIVAVKHYQLKEAAIGLQPLIGPKTTVVPLQNGIDAHDILMAVLGDESVVGGLTSIVSMIEAPGVIRQASQTRSVYVGELDKRKSERCQWIVDAWANCGVHAIQPEDIAIPMWAKYLFIASYGGVSSLAQVSAGELLACPESKELLIRAMQEIEALAQAKGIQLAPDVVSTTMTMLEHFEPTTTSSTQRDVAAGKPFELEAFSGNVVRMGREMSVPTPVHEMLYGLLKPRLIRAQTRMINDKS